MLGDPAPFDLPGDSRGVLCVHGFTATPFEMRFVGETLGGEGLSVMGPALPGHGTTPEDLATTTWHNWYEEVERQFDVLRQRCDQVAVVGQSLGGLLALHLAQNRGQQVAAAVSMAAPLWLFPVPRAVAAIMRRRRLVEMIPKTGVDIRDRAMKKRIPTYGKIPVRALLSLCDFMDVVAHRLDDVECPTLIMHSHSDHTAPYACSQSIFRGIGPRLARHISFDDSYHLLSLDIERDNVAATVGSFVQAHLGQPS